MLCINHNIALYVVVYSTFYLKGAQSVSMRDLEHAAISSKEH